MAGSADKLGVVVAVDGSPAADAATRWASFEAVLRNVPLTVVHAVAMPTVYFPPVPYPDSLGVRLEDEGKKAVMRAVKIAEEAMPADRAVSVGRRLEYAPPTLALVELSAGAELLVVGSAGHGVLARGLLGSVSSTVVRHAHCPVAVVRDGQLPDPHGRPVLVGVDGSRVSQLATAIAFDEASRRGVDLVALHAWSDVVGVEIPDLDWSVVEGEAERHLAEGLAGLRERYPDVTVHRIVVRDHPARQLADKADSAQLVVLGSHGRGGLTSLLLGSVSNAVVHSVQVPVIVARPLPG